MPRILCVWLQDGRNIVASCEESTAAKVKSAFYDRAASLTFTGEDSVEILSTAEVEGFAIVDRPVALSATTAIYHYVAV
jgi:hypothetical protein